MKIRSTALYAYLLDAGVLNKTPEEIDRAKRDYRRKYKQQWKQRKRPRKEIRVEVTIKQFSDIKIKAMELGLTHTAYARNAVLTSIGTQQVLPHKNKLLKVLQLVSMAAISSIRNRIDYKQLSEQLAEAESILLQYLKT